MSWSDPRGGSQEHRVVRRQPSRSHLRDLQAFQLALWAHAQLIWVHPFEDGNGRSARALMNWIVVRLGLRPIAIEVPKEEYHDCLNHYFANDDLGPLVDLALRLYPVT